MTLCHSIVSGIVEVSWFFLKVMFFMCIGIGTYLHFTIVLQAQNNVEKMKKSSIH